MTWEPSLFYRMYGSGDGQFASAGGVIAKILIVRTARNYKLLSAKLYIYIIFSFSNLIKKISGKPGKGGLRAWPVFSCPSIPERTLTVKKYTIYSRQ